MRINKYIISSLLMAVIMVVVTASCKKYFDPPLVFEEEPAPNLEKGRKVLLISIDGLSGIELNEYVPVNIAKLLEKAKYTFDGFADGDTGDASTWTTMLSGKNSVKHGITGNDFEVDLGDPDNPDHEGTVESTGFIPVYQRLLETGKPYKSFSVTPWELLYDNLFGLSDERSLVQSDEEVKDMTVDKIKNGEENLTFAIVNFRSVNDAGVNGGFSLGNAAYKASLDQVDTYIGEILEAVKARESYAKENWLIIVTSNHGGTGKEYGGASFEERKVPVIFFNENFDSLKFSVPDLGQFVRLTGSWSAPIRAIVPADKAAAFNFGTTGEYTVQLKMNLKARGATWPGFFGKKKSTNNANAEPGWSFMFYDPANEPKWRPHIGHQTDGNVNQLSNRGIILEQWTTLTMKIYEEGGKRYAQCFTDNDKHVNLEITGRNLDNNEPLILGGLPGWISTTATFDVSDIRIYNVALPDDYIIETFCQGGTNEGDNYYDDLIAYWPVREGTGDVLEDMIGGANFVFERFPSWTIAANNFCNLPQGEEEAKNQLLINHLDVLPQVFYWLNMIPDASWNLEGSVFLERYEREFIGK